MNGTLDQANFELRVGLSWSIAIISAFAVFSNLLVVVLFIRHKPLRTSANILVTSLACADAVFSSSLFVSQMFPRKELLSSSSMLCVILYTLIPWSSLASPWSLLAITIDRLIYIKLPLTYNRWVGTKSVAVVITTIWMTSLGFTLLALIPWPLGDRTKQVCGNVFTKTLPYIALYFLLVALPCLAVCALYCIILQYARQNRKYHQELVILVQPRNLENNPKEENLVEEDLAGVQTDESYRKDSDSLTLKNRKQQVASPRRFKRIAKTTKMFFYLTIIFFILWLPMDIMTMLIFLCAECRESKHVVYSFWISITLYTISPLINPWVYTLRNRDFRTALRKFAVFRVLITEGYSESSDYPSRSVTLTGSKEYL